MFRPKTEKIEKLSEEHPETIEKLNEIFRGKTNIYIDFANVLGWQSRLGWRVDLKRLKQLLDSFENVNSVKFYYGTLTGDKNSEQLIKFVQKIGYEVTTKFVKIVRLSIDTSSVSPNSPSLLENFIRKPLLDKFSLETIEFLNQKLKELNEKGIIYIRDRKCNFDVEIGRAMLRDYDKDDIDIFALWSGDSDFAGPVSQLMRDGKRVIIFATARRISVELAGTGAQIFDIKKMKEFICWHKDLQKSQKDPRRALKL